MFVHAVCVIHFLLKGSVTERKDFQRRNEKNTHTHTHTHTHTGPQTQTYRLEKTSVNTVNTAFMAAGESMSGNQYTKPLFKMATCNYPQVLQVYFDIVYNESMLS